MYHTCGDYTKATEFAEAEKLFHEAVVVDRKVSCPSGDVCSADADYACLLISKADEYNELSRVCSDQKQCCMALDYCGKALKIQQSVYGPNDAHTQRTMERFTILFAKVDKEQSTAAVEEAASIYAETTCSEVFQNMTLVSESPEKDNESDSVTLSEMINHSSEDDVEARPFDKPNTLTPNDSCHLANDTSGRVGSPTSESNSECQDIRTFFSFFKFIPAWLLVAAIVLLLCLIM